MQSVRERAFPRVGLLGNPSDGYEGKVLAFTFENFAARVELDPRPAGLELLGPDGSWRGTDRDELARALAGGALAGGPALLAAAWLVRADAAPTGLRLAFTSDIPRQVGLAGSSAIVVAALRALDRSLGRASDPFEVAESALEAETRLLKVAAGPQDRVAQAYEGLLAMDFTPPRAATRYRRLDPDRLPPLLVAYDPDPGPSSSVSHARLRERWERGEPAVQTAIQRFVELAERGEQALVAGDRMLLAELLDASFDTRASIWPLGDVDRRLVDIARARGAAAKLCGSGGAAVILPREDTDVNDLTLAYEQAGLGCLAPRVTRAPRGALACPAS